jgi:hypothetical protein
MANGVAIITVGNPDILARVNCNTLGGSWASVEISAQNRAIGGDSA